MPKPSEFVLALRSHGIHESQLRRPDSPFERRYFASHVAKNGSKRDEVLSELELASQLTRDLLSASLPRSKSELTSRQLHCSNFVRIGVWGHPPNQSSKRRLLALVHASIELDVPADFDPRDTWFPQGIALQPMVLTLRLLDLHLCKVAPIDFDAVQEWLGWALSQQLFDHLVGPTLGLYDLENGLDDHAYVPKDLLRIRLQGNGTLSSRSVLSRTEQQFRTTCTGSSWPRLEAMERFELEGGVSIEQGSADDSFERSVTDCLTSRKASAKPKRVHEAPQAVHHLMICSDPVLRLSKGLVINLSAMAVMQSKADASRAEMDMEEFDLDDDEVDWGPGYESRLQRMRENSVHELLKWIFVVDDGTNVFAAVPVPASQLNISTLHDILQSVWRGEHGILRGPPLRLSLPTRYATDAARGELAMLLDRSGVQLTKPTSGFASPIWLKKVWTNASCRIEKYDRCFISRSPPASMSLQMVRDWAFAHLLSEHAHSHFENASSDPMGNYLAFVGGGYPSCKTIQVANYMQATNLGDPADLFLDWKSRCLADFQSDFSFKRETAVTSD